MRLTRTDIYSRIEKIAKQVDEISHIKSDTSKITVKLLDRVDLMMDTEGTLFQKFIKSHTNVAYYLHNSFNLFGKKIDILGISKNFFGNDDYLNITIGHEIMHNAQNYSFPDLYSKKIHAWKNNLKEYAIYRKLTEGDAILIEEELKAKYYQNPNFQIPKTIKKYLSKENLLNINNLYTNPAIILKKEFNGDRTEINKLYSSSIEELTRIFNQ